MKTLLSFSFVLISFWAISQDTTTCASNTTSLLAHITSTKIGNKIQPFNFSQPYYMAIYNQSTMSFDFYPSPIKCNFNLNSAQTSNFMLKSSSSKDSFNPTGANSFKSGVVLGLFNYIVFNKL